MLDTLANVKTSLLVSGTTDDALLTRLMDAADAFITEFTSRDFAGGSFTETHPAGRSLVFLRNYPVAAVTSLKVDAARQFGPETARSADTFVVHADRGVIESVCGPFLPPRFAHRDDWPAAVGAWVSAAPDLPTFLTTMARTSTEETALDDITVVGVFRHGARTAGGDAS